MDKDKADRIIRKVCDAAARGGYEARLVGGAVRDRIMGKVPNDLDFAVNCDPFTCNLTMLKAGFRTVPTGIKHGTITVIVDGESVEITSLRKDVSTDGRRATVEFTDDWKVDASRRDFTMNAMFMDRDGNITDYFGGLDDIANSRVRFVGDPALRMEEDYLRILRYFRFSSILPGVNIDEDVLNVVKEKVSGLEKISGERIWSELIKTFEGKSRLRVAAAMHRSYVFDHISEALTFDNRTYSKMENLDSNPRALSGLYFISAMIESVDDIPVLNEKLKFDRNSEKIIRFIVRGRGEVLTEEKADTAMALGVEPENLYHLAVYMGDIDLAHRLNVIRLFEPIPRFPVSGNAIKEFGYEGREIGEILDRLKVAWAASKYKWGADRLLETVERKSGAAQDTQDP